MNTATAQATQDVAAPVLTTISIPPINAAWPGQGGKFRGIVRGENGGRDYLLIERDDELPQSNWKDALAAAAAVEADGHKDFSLPNRAEAALLYANAKEDHKTDDWYWTSEQLADDPQWAWMQTFGIGSQGYGHKDLDCRARAVRRLVIR